MPIAAEQSSNLSIIAILGIWVNLTIEDERHFNFSDAQKFG